MPSISAPRRIPPTYLNPDAPSLNGLTTKHLYRIISQAISQFNRKAEWGIEILKLYHILPPNPEGVAHFLKYNHHINKVQIGRYISASGNEPVLQEFVKLHACKQVFLGEALRDFLSSFELPSFMGRNRYHVLESFANHYWISNENLTYDKVEDEELSLAGQVTQTAAATSVNQLVDYNKREMTGVLDETLDSIRLILHEVLDESTSEHAIKPDTNEGTSSRNYPEPPPPV
ncbi:GDP/GTP exchange factor for ARF [Quaeritorhiza haematococci]|nr:GDP/GTP exchange factor for ARF [Quaeritorhiza haematococci]